ncbi:hypothetical protein D9M71_480330 [compost metagenome]
MVAVEADLGGRIEYRAQRGDPRGHVIGQHVAGRVGDVHAVGAVALHQLALLGQPFGAVHVRHHQEADGVHLQLAGDADVLLGNVRLGAVGGHADGVHAQVAGHAQVVDGADARQQQGGDLGLLHQRDHRRQVFLVAVRREAVVHRASAQAVAVGDLDQRHAGGVQAAGDVLHLLQADLVALGMHAVAQAHVVDGDFLAAKIHGRLLRRGRVAGRGSVRP